ncbi:MAG: sigma-70 family RNA polymerase sigma factor [Microcoleaceae cyanobacterium]
MPARQNLIDIFSSFLQFAEDRFHSWVQSPKLQSSMKKQIEHLNAKPAGDRFWSLYWHRIWQQHQSNSSKSGQSSPTVTSRSQELATEHLLAYLQEPCYWVAKKASDSKFGGTHYSVADLFQIGITQFNRVLKGFDTTQGSNLKDYAGVAFKSVIRDVLRQRQETDICSDWALLRKLSRKRMRESLENAALSSTAIEQYLLAWNCFKTLYVPHKPTGTRQLSKPDSDTWHAIAQYYNQESSTSVNPELLEKWLTDCAKWARSYLYPKVGQMPSQPNDPDQVAIDIPADDPDPLTAQMIDEELHERQQQQARLHQIVRQAVAQMKPDLREILTLYYIQGLTQQQIAQQLETRQYTVSRRLTRSREVLLKALLQWSQQEMGVTLTTEDMGRLSTTLEEWLENLGELEAISTNSSKIN